MHQRSGVACLALLAASLVLFGASLVEARVLKENTSVRGTIINAAFASRNAPALKEKVEIDVDELDSILGGLADVAREDARVSSRGLKESIIATSVGGTYTSNPLAPVQAVEDVDTSSRFDDIFGQHANEVNEVFAQDVDLIKVESASAASRGPSGHTVQRGTTRSSGAAVVRTSGVAATSTSQTAGVTKSASVQTTGSLSGQVDSAASKNEHVSTKTHDNAVSEDHVRQSVHEHVEAGTKTHDIAVSEEDHVRQLVDQDVDAPLNIRAPPVKGPSGSGVSIDIVASGSSNGNRLSARARTTGRKSASGSLGVVVDNDHGAVFVPQPTVVHGSD